MDRLSGFFIDSPASGQSHFRHEGLAPRRFPRNFALPADPWRGVDCRGLKQAPGTAAATSLVIASMIGTGVFTSLGYQLVGLSSGPQILLLWLLGGLLALCGALSYAAVAAHLPRSGGEHHFLGTLFHPALGFMAGVLSVVVGFAAPTALSALAFAEYLGKAFPGLPAAPTAAAVVLLGSTAHAFGTRTSARVQLAATALKLGLILAFLVAAVFLPGKGDIRWSPEPATDFAGVLQPAFVVSLFFVFYAYSGWNAAIYGLEDWDQPKLTVRRALVGGTILVTLLYLALHVAFLHAAPVAALRGEAAVGEIAARHLLGPSAAKTTAILFAVGLFASVSAMLWAGPRVLAAMGDSLPSLRLLRSPRTSLGIIGGLALVFVFASPFRELVLYTQTGLVVCTLLTTAGVFRLPRPRPVIPACLFLGFTSFVVIRSIVTDPLPTLAGLATAALAAILWFPLKSPPP